MKIFLLTPVYAITTGKNASTPVVHYFAKEWVKQGHDVTVFHLEPKYPSLFYWFAKKIQHKLIAYFSQSIPVEAPKDSNIVADGVRVKCITYNKYIPHSRVSKSAIKGIVRKISCASEMNGAPDVLIGHWDNPQLDVLPALKNIYNVSTCLVLHNNEFHLEKTYGKETNKLLSQIDIIGFRNASARMNFENKYGQISKSFIAYSGVSESFLKAGMGYMPDFSTGVRNYMYVGILLKRKYPAEILESLEQVSGDGNFSITYAGDGECRNEIVEIHKKYNKKGTVNLLGRIAREDIIKYLKKCQVFVMISKSEIFGLVYLEAMAMGLIPIGSRNEGIDGIIVDGKNGFLCEAGNVIELSAVIKRINNMSTTELIEISNNARQTAMEFSDFKVAKKYIDFVKQNII